MADNQPPQQAALSSPPNTGTDRPRADKHWLDYLTALGAIVAAIAAIAAAIFADWQLSVARDTEIVTSRAFVMSNSFQYITYQEPSEAGRMWHASPIIENVGNTQTRNLSTFTNGAIGGTPNDFPWKDSAKQTPRVHRLIGPKGSSIAQAFNADPQGFNQLQTGPRFGAVGVIRYQDIFGGWHLTEYCYVARPVTHLNFQNFPANQPVRAEGQLCEQHNCADEECGPDWEKRARE
ncbi:hypothetical protein ACQR2B_31035 [Bradyrhizobium oligotrophicum]|uniref:hypothetical protein n=1 Tax=Bradyrhizobium TaxID=374 RepID=UPI003EBAE2FC